MTEWGKRLAVGSWILRFDSNVRYTSATKLRFINNRCCLRSSTRRVPPLKGAVDAHYSQCVPEASSQALSLSRACSCLHEWFGIELWGATAALRGDPGLVSPVPCRPRVTIYVTIIQCARLQTLWSSGTSRGRYRNGWLGTQRREGGHNPVLRPASPCGHPACDSGCSGGGQPCRQRRRRIFAWRVVAAASEPAWQLTVIAVLLLHPPRPTVSPRGRAGPNLPQQGMKGLLPLPRMVERLSPRQPTCSPTHLPVVSSHSSGTTDSLQSARVSCTTPRWWPA